MSRRKSFEFAMQSSGVLESPVRDEILRKTRDDGVSALEGAKLIDRDRLRPDPEQPRRHFDSAELQALASSLMADGMQSPITAFYDDADEAFTIITGERRWRASGIAGMARVPVLVVARPAHPADTLGKQLAENLLRADLTELEKARALARLRDIQPQTWVELARRHGLTDRRVHQMLSLLHTAEPIQVAVQSGRISGRHARAIARLPAEPQMEVLAQVIGEELSARATEELVRRMAPPTDIATPPTDTGGSADEQESAEQEPDADANSASPHAGPPVEAVTAIMQVTAERTRRRQVRRVTGRVEAMERQLRNLRVEELLPSVADLPEYVLRMRRLRDALEAYIAFLERVHLDAPGEMESPEITDR
jgi:ParB family chromosome partitioning protein